MSETAKQLFDSLKAVKEGIQAAAPGLQNFVPEVKAELSRLGTQGAMELASALFNGNGFVPYGPGQYTPSPEHGVEHGHEQGQQLGQEQAQEHSQEQSQEMGRER